MAARRLLIVMLVLLGVATLLAALVGDRTLREEGTSSTIASEAETETETVPTDTLPEGDLRTEAIEVGKGKPVVVRMEVGEQLELIVSAAKADQLEIPALDLLEPVFPDAPARFDILAETDETYGVRLVRADRVVARIEVTEPATDSDNSQGV